MARPERYFIGPGVKDKLQDVIYRVSGTPLGSGGGSVPTRLQGMQGPPAVTSIRAGTFTGSWNIGSTKAVTFTTSPTATVSVTNISWPISHNHVSPENCVVGKDGSSWWLVVPVLQSATTTVVTQSLTVPVVTDVSISATLNTSNCAITIGKTVVTSSITVVSQTSTASYIRLRVP